MGDIESVVDALHALGLALGLVVVADSVQQEVPETPFLKDFAKNVKDTTFKGVVDGFELGEQAMIDLALHPRSSGSHPLNPLKLPFTAPHPEPVAEIGGEDSPSKHFQPVRKPHLRFYLISTHGHHWCGNAESCFLIGDALGEGMKSLLK